MKAEMNPTGPHPGWQERTIQLLGKASYERLERSNVLVVGMGGVGSMAAEMICRSGVGRMTIIDADTIQPSNLNRQLPATHASLGKDKAEVMGERLRQISSACLRFSPASSASAGQPMPKKSSNLAWVC